MKNKKLMRLLIGLVCMAVCVALAGCVEDSTPTQPPVSTTEPVTEAPVETTQAPTEAPTEQPTEPPTEQPTEMPTEAPTEAPVDSPSSGPVNSGTGGGYTPIEPEETQPETTEPETIEVASPGSDTNPYYESLDDSGEFSTAQVPAGESIHYVLKTSGTYLRIEDPELALTVDGMACEGTDGFFEVQLPADSSQLVRMELANQGSEAKAFAVKIVDRIGGVTNPQDIETVEDLKVTLPEGDEDGYCYRWTAPNDGVLKLWLQNAESVSADLAVTVGKTQYQLSETDTQGLRVPVSQNAEVLIHVVPVADAEGNIPAQEVELDGYLACYVDMTVESLPYAEQTVEIPAGQSVIYRIGGAAGKLLHITGQETAVIYGGTGYLPEEGKITLKLAEETPTEVEIFNAGSQQAAFDLEIGYPLGHQENPIVLDALGEITTQAHAELDGCWYSYTAPAAGQITFQVWEYPTGENAKTDIHLMNLRSGAEAGLWSSDENGDPVEAYTVSVTVKAGDTVLIHVSVTENDAAADAQLLIYGDLYGSEENPIQIQYPGFVAEVPAGQTLYYCGYNLSDLLLSVSGEKFSLSHNDQLYQPEEGKIQLSVVAAGRMPALFAVSNTGTEDASYTGIFTYPVGHMENPDQLILGTTRLNREAGKFEYCLNYTAPKAGKLVFTFDAAASWCYTVDNQTQQIYGETQFSDSDPLVAETELAVNAGDTVQIRVNTYNPETPWESPAGEVAFEATLVTGPEAITNLNLPTTTQLVPGETHLFTGKAQGYSLAIYDAGGCYIEFNGTRYAADASGKIQLDFPTGGTEAIQFALHSGKAEKSSFNLQFSTKDTGSALNPQIVTAGSYTMVQNTDGGADYYYRFVADRNGTLILTFDTDVDCIYIVNNTTVLYTHKGQNVFRINVRAGAKINFCVNTYDQANPMVSPVGSVDFTVEFN